MNPDIHNKHIYGAFLAFDETFFAKHQTKLLFLLNTPIIKIWFRYILRIRQSDLSLHKKIEAISSNRFTIDAGLQPYVIEGKIVMLPSKTTDFRTHNKYSKRLYYAFKPLWWVMHYWDEIFADRYAPAFSFGFDTLTVYPPNGTSPVSGYIRRNGVNQSLSAIRADSGTTASGYDEYLHTYLESDVSSSVNNFYANYRSIIGYNTSSLTADAVISSAVLSLYSGNAVNEFGGTNPSFHIAQGSVVSNTSLSNSDYEQAHHGTTSFANIAFASWASGVYNDFTFNSTGRGAIDKTGLSYFSFQSSWDLNNSFTGTWAVTKVGGVRFAYGVNQSGTSQDPKLVVTYTLGTAYTKSLTETIALVDTKNIFRPKAFVETVALVDTVHRSGTRRFTETITLVDTVTKGIVFLFRIVESLSITDKLAGLLNGLNFRYRKKYADEEGEYRKKYRE